MTQGKLRVWRMQLTGAPALTAACVLTLILTMVPRSMADPDIWWHLRNAAEMVAHYALVRRDVYSFTAAGSPWIDHEWMAELAFYGAWRADGATGVYGLTLALIGAIFAGVLWLCWRASGSWRTASLVTVTAVLLSTVSFGPRMLLFGWLCLVLELIVLDLFRSRQRVILVLPVLFGFWVNLHGSWVIGLVVLALDSVFGLVSWDGAWMETRLFDAEHRRMLSIAWTALLPALLLNPWGWRLPAYPFNFAFQQTLNVASVEEWQSLDLHSLRGRILMAALVLLAGRQMMRPRRWRLVELAWLLLGLYAGFSHTRFLFLLALLAAPLAARSFPAMKRDVPVRARGGMNALVMLAVAGVAFGGVRRERLRGNADLQRFPAAMLPALAHVRPGGRVFNEFLWGGYLEWNRPDLPVFIDSRVDLFEENGTFQDYLSIVQIRDSLLLLDRYRISYVLFENDTPLVYLLRHTGGWRVLFEDGRDVLLERDLAAPGPDIGHPEGPR